METKNNKTYRSPKRKLVSFFEKSRDQWKTKYQEVKKIIKRQQNRIRFLERSKEQYKEKVRELEAEVEGLRAAQSEKREKLRKIGRAAGRERGEEEGGAE